ncbi:hypothetical protein GCM10027034_11320 [Ramlibacter solisilvae]|uniref:DUF1622 domain-containing protein n=1 Tax=Ramlibacter tataouinensis TaxID=94132 RepID=A0A127JXE9_9BURK|nr:DUF1622 domain-containing protein [Ramlibacter tataouinensis]AMO24575.1 hypothetical protein UC35_19170 [Ramlibacter tataouinensis]
MREWIFIAGEYTVLLIDAIALILILVGTLQAAFAAGRALFSPLSESERKATWLRYARILSGALTFLLGADILETALTKDLETVAHVAAVAVIRTFLNYFLARDEAELKAEMDRETAREARA